MEAAARGRLDRTGHVALEEDTLALAAGELVRIAAEVIGAQPHRLEEVDDALLALLAGLGELVDDQRLSDDRAHGHARVEGGVGILEDDLHVAAKVPQRALVEGGDVLAFEVDLARRRLDEPQDAPA